MIAKYCHQIFPALLYLFIGFVGMCPAQEWGDTNEYESVVSAPADTREMSSTLGGAYFVEEELLERYEAITTRLSQVRRDISLGTTTSDAATESLTSIQKESLLLRKELEEKKVLVSAFHVYSKISEEIFPLGEERLVVVTGDNVVVRGWGGPGIKCVVEKIIVAKERPADSEFDAIQVEHELTIAADKVGLTKAQRNQQEDEFFKSESGRKLSEEQRATRKRLIAQIQHSFDSYLAFQGREVNSIQLTGLDHQEGNRNLLVRINSPGGGETLSSQWQRHATMTLYVPVCNALAIRGCQAGLDVSDIECDLVLTTADSRDRKFEGTFSVRSVNGNVTIDQAPVRVLSDVSGDVRFTATDEFVNSGSLNENGSRTVFTYDTRETRIDHVSGNVSAEFLRTDLKLNAIKGALDIVNNYGETSLTIESFDSDRANRIVSESGKITVVGHADVLNKLPIYAYTQCGRLHTNVAAGILDEQSFSTGQPQLGWHGFVTPIQERFSTTQFERPAAALVNKNRTPGLDLISHAGMVSILTMEEPEAKYEE